MSKFTLDKLKELCDQNVSNSVQTEDIGDTGVQDPYTAALNKDVSPIKEKLLTTFAQLTPAPSNENPENKTDLVEREDSSSWLTNVKGKLAKTVDSSLERYHELKAEREKAKLSKFSESSLDLDDEHLLERKFSLSHSTSEISFSEPPRSVKERPQSEIFEFDPKEFEKEGAMRSPSKEIPIPDKTEPIPISSSTPTSTETPSKTKKKFGIQSLFSRSNTPASSSGNVAGSPGTEEFKQEKIVEKKQETPKRTVKQLFSDYVHKSGSETGISISPPKDLPLTDPFSDSDMSLVITEKGTPEDTEDISAEIEEGVDAAEMSPEEDGGVTMTTPNQSIVTNQPLPPQAYYNPPPALPDLVSPILVAILAVANFILPTYISGFLTGAGIAMVATYWLCCFLYPSADSTNLSPPEKSESIEIHEAPAIFQSWMNLLPPQLHPYDIDTYDVRNTISVRVSVELHYLKIEYPEWNIPKRLSTDEIIPSDLKFLYHSDHVDLTRAKISLLPDGIAGKRMFSKKYPIEIRPLSFNESQQPQSLLKNRKLSRSKESINSEDSDIFKDVVGTPPKNSPTSETPDRQVFYLFARSDREKEDIYKVLTDAHHFLTDTVLDVARKEGAITEGIDRDAGGRETVRERKTKFNDFMARVFENQKRNTEEDLCIGFINVFLNRIFYDIHKSENVKTMLKTRVYNKLLKIKITQWFKSIELTEINMGKTLPKICWVSNLHQDDRGLWVELGVQYDGVASATIETCGLIIGDEIPDSGSAAVQLRALLEETETALPVKQQQPEFRRVSSRIVAATNSDEEDSAEEDSDSQELELPVEQVVGSGGQSAAEVNMSRAKWWEVIGKKEIVQNSLKKLSNSEWFQQKTNKKMTLQLEVSSLKGILVLNIPPPPSDRLWYSFKEKPELGLRIVPFYGGEKLGMDNTFFSRAINKIVNIVTHRLKEEIHKFVLLPNMDDIPIKIMDPFPSTNEIKS